MDTTLIKLTEKDGTSHGGFLWGKGKTLSLPKIKNPRLCTSDVIHAYRDINLAFLLDTIHADFLSPIAWEAKGRIVVEDWGKVGCFKLTILRKLPTPKWVGGKDDAVVRIRFAVLCAKAVLHIYEEAYPNDGRPRRAIEAAEYILNSFQTRARTAANAALAAEAAEEASRTAALAAKTARGVWIAGTAWAAANAAWAARTAANAAWAAAKTAWGVWIAGTAWAAVNAAWAARTAAEAAEAALAAEAAEAKELFDFVVFAKKASSKIPIIGQNKGLL